MKTLLIAALLATSAPALAAGPWVPTGWWKLNETGGVSLVDSVNGNTGTAYGPTVDVGCNGGSRCRHFDGVNDFADIPWSTTTQPGAKNFRAVVTIWPQLPRPANGDDIFRSSGYPRPFWKMTISDAGTAQGKLSCSFRGTRGQSSVAGGPDLYDNVGHTVECRLIHLASGVDRTEGWVNGTRRFYLDKPVGAIQTNVSTIVGAHCCVDANYFTGWLDDLRLYTQTP